MNYLNNSLKEIRVEIGTETKIVLRDKVDFRAGKKLLKLKFLIAF